MSNILPSSEVPICAICKKPVDRFEWMYRPDMFAKVFRAYCHGDMQEVALNDMDFEGRVELGMAFDFKRLTND